MQRPIELTAGDHIVSVRERGHHSWSREVSLKRGEKLELRPSLASTRQRKLSYWVGGTSAVMLGVGTLYFAASAGSNRDAKAFEEDRLGGGLSTEQFALYQRAIDDRDSERLRGFGFVAAGGILAVAGGLLYLVDMPGLEGGTPRRVAPESGVPEAEEDFAPMSLVPSLSPGAAGLALQRRF